MIKINSMTWLMTWLAGALAACSGQAPVQPNGGGATANGTATATGDPADGISAGAGGSTASSTGFSSSVTGNGAGQGGSDPTLECDDTCEPCDEDQRRDACEPLCVCETIDENARDQQQRLLTCDWGRPCDPASFRYSVEAGAASYGSSGSECLFKAFRDRTAGRFDVTYDGFEAESAIEHSEFVFLLDGSDSMLMLYSGFYGHPGSNAQRLTYTRSCALADPSVFEQCLAAPDYCVHSRGWLHSCVETTAEHCPGQ